MDVNTPCIFYNGIRATCNSRNASCVLRILHTYLLRILYNLYSLLNFLICLYLPGTYPVHSLCILGKVLHIAPSSSKNNYNNVIS